MYLCRSFVPHRAVFMPRAHLRWDTTIARIVVVDCAIRSSSTTQNKLDLFLRRRHFLFHNANFPFCTSFSINIFMQPKYYFLSSFSLSLSLSPFLFYLTNTNQALNFRPFHAYIHHNDRWYHIFKKLFSQMVWGWIIYRQISFTLSFSRLLLSSLPIELHPNQT